MITLIVLGLLLLISVVSALAVWLVIVATESKWCLTLRNEEKEDNDK